MASSTTTGAPTASSSSHSSTPGASGLDSHSVEELVATLKVSARDVRGKGGRGQGPTGLGGRSVRGGEKEAIWEKETRDRGLTHRQAVCAKDQALQRAHSFQIVGLQSRVHELGRRNAARHAASEALRRDVDGLLGAMAYLKGRVARLAVEQACLDAKVDAAQPPPQTQPQGSRAQQPPASLLDRLRASGGSFDALADELLREQKQRLLAKLVSAGQALASTRSVPGAPRLLTSSLLYFPQGRVPLVRGIRRRHRPLQGWCRRGRPVIGFSRRETSAGRCRVVVA